MARHKFAPKSTASRGPIPKPHYLPHPWTRPTYGAKRHPDPIRRFFTMHWTDRPTDRSRESFTTIGRCAPRATRPNNNWVWSPLWVWAPLSKTNFNPHSATAGCATDGTPIIISEDTWNDVANSGLCISTTIAKLSLVMSYSHVWASFVPSCVQKSDQCSPLLLASNSRTESFRNAKIGVKVVYDSVTRGSVSRSKSWRSGS